MLLAPELFGFPPYGSEIDKALIPLLKERVINALKNENCPTDLPVVVIYDMRAKPYYVKGYVFNSPLFEDGQAIKVTKVHSVKCLKPGVYSIMSGDDKLIAIGSLFNWAK